MSDLRPGVPFAIVRRPVHAHLTQVPVVCFTGALLTDLAYSQSPDMQWANFSAWLLFFGIIFGVLAAVAWLIDFGRHRRSRREPPPWPYAIGALVVLVLALLNNFIHSRDAWTSVVPDGLILSALTVLAMIVTAFLGRPIAYAMPTGEVR